MKVEILAAHIYGYNNTKYVRGDIVDIPEELVKAFGKACKVLDDAPKPAAKRGRPRKVKVNED